MLALMLLLAGAGSRAEETPLPLVDLGVREFDIQGPITFARRTDDDWWALAFHRKPAPDGIDERARVFRSTDKGLTWREDREAASAIRAPTSLLSSASPRFEFLIWYTPSVGIIAGDLGNHVFRTSDGGRTWKKITLTKPLSLRAMARVGQRTWLCGVGDTLLISNTQGAEWRELSSLPFQSITNRCESLSFRDENHGWVVGSRSGLWETKDGGLTWHKLPLPEQPPIEHSSGERPPPFLHQALLLSSRVGWVLGAGGRFQTTDGGLTWKSRPLSPEQSQAGFGIAHLKPKRHIVTVGHTAPNLPLSKWVPALERITEVMGPDTVVSIDRRYARRGPFRWDVAGKRIRAAPLISQGPRQSTRLLGLFLPPSGGWFGWTSRKVLASHDQGKTWFVRGGPPSTAFPLQRLDVQFGIHEEQLLAQTEKNETWHSVDGGFTWSRISHGLDDYERAVKTGLSLKEMRLLPTPRCLLLAPDSILKAQFGIQGEGHQGQGHLVLTQSADHISVSGGHASDRTENIQVPTRRYVRPDGEWFLRDLVDAATQPERPAECDAHLRHVVTLEWTCGVQEPAWHRIDFQSPICPKDVLYQPPNSFTDGEPEDAPSMRARSLHHTAHRLLHDARP
ncbi:hypothetical protein MFU01_11560 [Myxococcus fulvus]|uniref:Photosynthesis system II assembly factor Ycf48/Hcf136-like domain-containing protein n=1 Tax=Myxococcus fulvus TaxID=33 RepID=A0A511SW39_MYXFU|nr:hypothetical protein MFU01_11560 [Myxococcus fulvus]